MGERRGGKVTYTIEVVREVKEHLDLQHALKEYGKPSKLVVTFSKDLQNDHDVRVEFTKEKLKEISGPGWVQVASFPQTIWGELDGLLKQHFTSGNWKGSYCKMLSAQGDEFAMLTYDTNRAQWHLDHWKLTGKCWNFQVLYYTNSKTLFGKWEAMHYIPVAKAIEKNTRRRVRPGDRRTGKNYYITALKYATVTEGRRRLADRLSEASCKLTK